MKIQVDFHIQKYDLIAILDLLSLLSVLVAGQDLEIDCGGGLINKLDFVTGFFHVSASFLGAKVRFRIDVEKLDL